MTAHLLDPEARARLAADHRARRGPFRHDVVSAYEVASHYSVRRMPAGAFLREVAVLSLWGYKAGMPYAVYVLDEEVARLPRMEIGDHFRRERGLPPKPRRPSKPAPVPALPEELTTDGAQAVEALWPAVADAPSFSELVRRLYDRGVMSLPGSERRAIALALADRLGLKVSPASLEVMLTPSFTRRRMSGRQGQ